MISSRKSKTLIQFLRTIVRGLSHSIQHSSMIFTVISMIPARSNVCLLGPTVFWCAETRNSKGTWSVISSRKMILLRPYPNSTTVKSLTFRITGRSLPFTKYKSSRLIEKRRKHLGKRFLVNWWDKDESTRRRCKTWTMSWQTSLIKSSVELKVSRSILYRVWRQYKTCLTSTRNRRWWTELGTLQWQSKWKKERSHLRKSPKMPSSTTSWASTMSRIRLCSQTKTTTKNSILMLLVSPSVNQRMPAKRQTPSRILSRQISNSSKTFSISIKSSTTTMELRTRKTQDQVVRERRNSIPSLTLKARTTT